MSDNKPSAAVRILKLVIYLSIIGVAAVTIPRFLEKRNLIQRENQAIEHWNHDASDKALEIYLELYPKLKNEDHQRVGKAIAECYCAQADEPALSFKERVEVYRQAYQYDPSSVKNPRIVEMITK